MYGNFTMGLYQKVLMFITKTTIRSTMTLAILNSWTQRNILLNTHYQKFINYLSAKSAELGINVKTRVTIATAPSVVGQNPMLNDTIKWKGNVGSVKNDLPPINILGQPSVLKTVRIKTIVNGTKKIPVYGITVGNSHEYFANDILVSNSVYWRVGMDKFKNDGGKIFTGEQISFPTGTQVLPDNSMPWIARFNYPEKDE